MEPSSTQVCFTGHRDLCQWNHSLIRERLHAELLNAVRQGKQTFLCGMSDGFDLMAAEEVIRLRSQGIPVHLTAVLPFPGQERSWDPDLQHQFHILCQQADELFTICEVPDCLVQISSCRHQFYRIRDEWMVEHSSLVLAFSNPCHPNPNNGTITTIRFAQSRQIPVINLCKA